MIINFCSKCGLDISHVSRHNCSHPKVHYKDVFCQFCGKLSHNYPCESLGLIVYVLHQVEVDDSHCDTQFGSVVRGVFMNTEYAIQTMQNLRSAGECWLTITPQILK